jgi:putative ABC transport system permease protein
LGADAVLNRIIDEHERRIVLPARGVVLSSKLADVLGVQPGDVVNIRVLDGERPELVVPVVALSEDFAGTAAFIEIGEFNRLLGEGDRITGAYLTVARGEWRKFLSELKQTPRVSSVVIKEGIRNSFRKTTAESMGLVQKIYMGFAVVVAFGIVYNSARISLSERQRELATLRVVGFTRGEVASVLISELVILTSLALPIGLLIGSGFATVILQTINTEFVRLPVILTTANFSLAVLVITGASFLSALFATRRLDRLDLVGALKARE